jgi:hypothetical protein
VPSEPHPDNRRSDRVHPQDGARDDEQAFQHVFRLARNWGAKEWRPRPEVEGATL